MAHRESSLDESKSGFERARSILELAVAQYHDRVSNEEAPAQMNEVSTTDVLHLIDKAKAILEKGSSEGNLWRRMRSAFKKMGRHEKVVISWMELLPRGIAYLSVVLGGVKLILGVCEVIQLNPHIANSFQMASEMHNLSEDVADIVCEIPIILINNCRLEAQEIDLESSRFQTLNVAVHTQILCALKLLFDYFDKSSFRRGAGALFKQKSNEMPFRDALEGIRKARAALKEEVEIGSHIIIREVKQTGIDTCTLVRNQIRDQEARQSFMQTEVAEAKEERYAANAHREDNRKEMIRRRRHDETVQEFMGWMTDKFNDFLSSPTPALLNAQAKFCTC